MQSDWSLLTLFTCIVSPSETTAKVGLPPPLCPGNFASRLFRLSVIDNGIDHPRLTKLKPNHATLQNYLKKKELFSQHNNDKIKAI